MSYCPNCGKELNVTDSFCPSCGKKLNLEGSPVQKEVGGEVKLRIKRMPSFVAGAMLYRVLIDGKEQCKLAVGNESIITAPEKDFTLEVSMIGNAICLYKMNASVLISPNAHQSRNIRCVIRTEKSWKGILTSALGAAPGQIKIDVEYK